MASFTDLVARHIQQRQQEFLATLSPTPHNRTETILAESVQRFWHPLPQEAEDAQPEALLASSAAVDGSRATRALNSGADWVIAQALLLGTGGLCLTAADTILLRGDAERPAVDRCAALLMRSLELDLALKYAQSGEGDLLLLDGSLYAELPHLLYPLAVRGQEQLPLQVLQRYLDLFECCQERGITLLGVSKSARSKALAQAILLTSHTDSQIALAGNNADTVAGDASADVAHVSLSQAPRRFAHDFDEMMQQAPTDAEILHRWTAGAGFSDPILLGTASFGHRRERVQNDPQLLAEQFSGGSLSETECRAILGRLRTAPAIGTFYIRLAPGDDVLRIDAPANIYGRADSHLLDFPHEMLPYQDAEALVGHLRRGYGGPNVYNAALYIVDREVRLHAQTVDHLYLSLLRRQLGIPIQFDRSTRRFVQ